MVCRLGLETKNPDHLSMIGVLLTEPDCFLLLGVAEEVHHLIIVIESNDEESIILVMVDLISHTDATASKEGYGVVEVVATEGRVVWDVQRLLASDKADGVVFLATLDVVGDGDPNLVKGIETDVDIVIHASV